MEKHDANDVEIRRLAIFERVKARLSSAGTPIDDDPRFSDLVGRWAKGEIDMIDVTRGYDELRQGAMKSGRSMIRETTIQASYDSQKNIIAELERVIGIIEPE